MDKHYGSSIYSRGGRTVSEFMDKQMESAVVELVNDTLFEKGVYLEKYQRVESYIFDQNMIGEIKRRCKFKDVGSVYDYPNELPQPEFINSYTLTGNFDLINRICISKKYNAILVFTMERHAIHCAFLVDNEKLKKFAKKIKFIREQDSGANMFRDIDFKCKDREYIEVSDADGDEMKPANVVKKKVPKETLVFDETSAIVEVMNDIYLFFRKETEEMYTKLQIPYKRGIIITGDPGNGKSAMLREIIRSIKDISKIVINPNVEEITKILYALTKSLEGKQAIVIVEDFDSSITNQNRSEFLNILDGIDVKSGFFFIGTTNYPDKIDPAFVNRVGRFDRTYTIGNPSEVTRRKFFESRDIGELFAEYKAYKEDFKSDTSEDVIEIFVKYSDSLPMASLKELITSTKYVLVSNPDISVEEAVEKSHHMLVESKQEHEKRHERYKRMKSWRRDDDDDDE